MATRLLFFGSARLFDGRCMFATPSFTTPSFATPSFTIASCATPLQAVCEQAPVACNQPQFFEQEAPEIYDDGEQRELEECFAGLVPLPQLMEKLCPS